ncbi:hypothetical protein ETB97_007524 [Aspergillus alliaceus]|uniref:F-box domain-containing protein n=1 Tax=Petromyces alliaceus TaxID=209559 RepID=A0A8H5ZU18_PETAA|nr:hypothetical protein ETB97_007524 [Aspergillus burnettii]
MASNKPTSQEDKPFSQLPADCLVSILDQLSVEESLAVSATCRDFHALAVPFAYRDVSLDWSTRPLHRLLQLLRLTLNNPDIASYIQHVSLVSSDPGLWEDTQPDMDWETESPNFRDVIDQSMDIVRRAGFSDIDGWTLGLNGGNIYCFAAIFLSQLPNLKSLRLDYSLVWWDGYPGVMLKQALLAPNGVLSTFQHLEVVDYGGNVPLGENEDFYGSEDPDGYPPYNPDQFLPWFCLPSLRHLNIWLRDIEGLQETVPELQLDKLETLILARTTISDADVAFLLSRTPNLRTLHVGMAYAFGVEKIVPDPPMLAQALKSVSSTLHSLSLGVEQYPGSLGDRFWGGEEDHICDSFRGILHSFPHLVSAEISLSVLLGWYVEGAPDLGPLLPKSLRRLCLREDLRIFYDFEWEQEEVKKLLHAFLPTWRDHTPELQSITWRLLNQNYMEGWEEFQDELRKDCADAGLTLELVVDDLGTGLWSRDESPFEPANNE